MLVSYLRRILELTLVGNARKILRREIKDYEKQSFFNRYGEQVQNIEAEAKQKLERLVNDYLENIK